MYREIARNRKPDGRYQPWYAHSQAYTRRRRPRPRIFAEDAGLRDGCGGGQAGQELVTSPDQPLAAAPLPPPGQLARVRRDDLRGVYRGLIIPADLRNLRTGRTYRHRRGRGRSRDGALKQSTKMKSIKDRPPAASSRRQAGHWEGDLIVGAAQRSAIATLVERKTRSHPAGAAAG